MKIFDTRYQYFSNANLLSPPGPEDPIQDPLRMLCKAGASALGGATIRLTIMCSMVTGEPLLTFCYWLFRALTNWLSRQSTLIQVSILYSCFQGQEGGTKLSIDSLFCLQNQWSQPKWRAVRRKGGKDIYIHYYCRLGMQTQYAASSNFGVVQERYPAKQRLCVDLTWQMLYSFGTMLQNFEFLYQIKDISQGCQTHLVFWAK